MGKKQFTNEEISSLCLGLSMVLKAGVAPGDGLMLLAEEEGSGPVKEVLDDMASRADEGMPLAEIFRRTGMFPAYVSSLLDVGQRTGRTEEALASLAKYYEERLRMERQIRSSLLYPAVLLVIMLVIMVVLLVKVLPVFDQVYGQMGSSLTGIAGGLLVFGQILADLMPLLCAALAAGTGVLVLFAWSHEFRMKMTGFWNRKFGHKGISGEINRAKTALVLAMAMKSGLPAEDALAQAGEMMADVPELAERLKNCSLQAGRGKPLASALKEYDILPPAECRLMEVGIRSGSGDEVMEQIAARMQENSEASLADAVGRVEPALVAMTSVLIGLILLSVMLPLVHIMAAIG